VNGKYFVCRGAIAEILKSFNFLAMGIGKIREIPNPGEVRDFVNQQFKLGYGLRKD
jgi:hypothetical protein